MPEKQTSISKSEIETILDVNRKAIELHTEVSNQYEEIVDGLENNSNKLTKIEDELKSISKNIEKIDRDLFKISVLMSSGIITLILTIIQMFIKK